MKARLAFSVHDLAETRFAVSPMWEVVTSFRALAAAMTPDPHRGWAEQVRPRLAAAGLDHGWLADMIPPAGHLPDFLNPAPATPSPGLPEELTAIAATSPEQVRQDLDWLAAERNDRLSARLQSLRRAPWTHLPRIVAEIEVYWRLAIAPYWDRIRSVLEADIFHRGRQVAEHGTSQALDGLHHTARWESGSLHLEDRHCAVTRIETSAGLLLVPSAFAWPRVLTRSGVSEPPQLAYPARGIGTLWERRTYEHLEALAAVIGRSRALMLSELETPVSTTELAVRSGLSAAGVSQHLTALRAAGLVTSHRAGRSVLYARTGLADALLTAQT
ncbi:ArsR/SmtB family transcription factor [Nonomuraea zeae]|uniref:Winged helix-turn-helix transcriptional regulator n=1 Tax=Nonomuraea zeae TaxID=1642303 RepID=A0A5S4FLK2_9ACTN|nr:winged helix-turn-helix domain-containing protein [Nonomuraea zeae]TMR21608.1 winged helix-turn-helix transcriptional regulator [Nonomuraea zeae]